MTERTRKILKAIWAADAEIEEYGGGTPDWIPMLEARLKEEGLAITEIDTKEKE